MSHTAPITPRGSCFTRRDLVRRRCRSLPYKPQPPKSAWQKYRPVRLNKYLCRLLLPSRPRTVAVAVAVAKSKGQSRHSLSHINERLADAGELAAIANEYALFRSRLSSSGSQEHSPRPLAGRFGLPPLVHLRSPFCHLGKVLYSALRQLHASTLHGYTLGSTKRITKGIRLRGGSISSPLVP
jgi:hypothetical protein